MTGIFLVLSLSLMEMSEIEMFQGCGMITTKSQLLLSSNLAVFLISDHHVSNEMSCFDFVIYIFLFSSSESSSISPLSTPPPTPDLFAIARLLLSSWFEQEKSSALKCWGQVSYLFRFIHHESHTENKSGKGTTRA